MIIGGVHRKYQIGVDEYILAVVCRPLEVTLSWHASLHEYPCQSTFPSLVCKRGVLVEWPDRCSPGTPQHQPHLYKTGI